MHILFKAPFFIIFLCFFRSFSQDDIHLKKIDSLSYLSYNTLHKNLSNTDTIHSLNILKAYLKKAKREKDTLKQAEAFRRLFIFNKVRQDNYYADSIIALTKGSSYKRYRMAGYFLKGTQLYSKGEYIKSLEYFLEARKSITKENPDVENYIGILKSRLGYNKEALVAYKKAMSYHENSGYKAGILNSYFNVSDVTRLLKQFDSSLYYCDLGYKLASEIKREDYETAFLFNKGATLSDMDKYQSSQKLLIKVLPEMIKLKDKPNTAITHFFIARNYKNLNKEKKAIYHLKQMDSIFLETYDLNPELRQGYEFLINYYKKKKDLQQQLTYVTRMLLVDSVINKNYHYLDKKLVKEYSRIELQNERKKLNNRIAKAENNSFQYLTLSLFVLTILIGLLIYKHFKHKKDIKKFKVLMSKSQIKNEKEQQTNNKITINDEVVEVLIAKLKEFERDHGYLNANVSRDTLAKQMDTNLAYLSKVINYYTGKTFKNYINDLRIDYTIERLKSKEDVFRKWSINAIAKEVGFKNTEPFSKAFYKKAGIKPSFFIKNLKKTH